MRKLIKKIINKVIGLNKFPPGWDEKRVREVINYYENQTEEEAVAEDESAFRRRDQAIMVVPKGLVATITKLITREETVAARGRHIKSLDRSAG